MKKSEKNTKKNIDILVEKLPPELQQEVCDFAQFLFMTKVKTKQKKLRLSWAGGNCIINQLMSPKDKSPQIFEQSTQSTGHRVNLLVLKTA